jgi:hypothetical protein
MRGGALPFLAWGALLLVLFTANWIWEGRLIQVGPTVGALLIIWGAALGLWLSRRDEALRRGEPAAAASAEALPASSTGAVIAGLSIGCIVFGVVWAPFLVYLGLAMLIVALARVGLELRAQRAARESAGRETGA